MDLVTEARVNRINELAAAVLNESKRKSQRCAPGTTARLGLSDEDVRGYSVARAIEHSLGLVRLGLERECQMAAAALYESLQKPNCDIRADCTRQVAANVLLLGFESCEKFCKRNVGVDD